VKLLGQRWEYRVGNSIVFVDNGFSWTGWGQERLVVNDETVQQSGGWWRMRQAFREPWLTLVGESELRVALVSRLRGISCSATLDGEPIHPDALHGAVWQGRGGEWPAPDGWIEAANVSWISQPPAG